MSGDITCMVQKAIKFYTILSMKKGSTKSCTGGHLFPDGFSVTFGKDKERKQTK